MKLSKVKFYDGAREKVCRLGLAHLFLELQDIVFNTVVLLALKRDSNGAAAVREALDEQFRLAENWVKTVSGGVDWVKEIRYDHSVLARMGVEIQVSSRSDLLIRDIVHLRNSLQDGVIDVGVILVPDDLMQVYLPDRTPSFRDAVRYVEQEFKEAMTFPIIIVAVEHDGSSNTPLPKRRTNLGSKTSSKRG